MALDYGSDWRCCSQVSIKGAAQVRREQQAKEEEAKAKQDAIWDGDDFKKHSGREEH